MQSIKRNLTAGLLLLGSGVSQAAPTTALPPAPGVSAAPGVQMPAAKATVATVMPPAAPAPQVSRLVPLAHAAAVPAPEPQPENSAMQQYIQKMVEEDYDWQAKKRAAANELELEKMNSEIRKLRGEENMRPVSQPVAESTQGEASAKSSSGGFPHILLESSIGGLSRIAVGSADGSTLLYVSPGDRFILGGQHYQLLRDKKSGLYIKETDR